MKVYLNNLYRFPKRIDNDILCYYTNKDSYHVILRKAVKVKLQKQNYEIMTNQKHLCRLWYAMPLRLKKLFAIYASIYRKTQVKLRKQGVSGFSIFIQLVYKIKNKLKIKISDLSYEFLYAFFQQHKNLASIMKHGFLTHITGFGSKIYKSFFASKLCIYSFFTEELNNTAINIIVHQKRKNLTMVLKKLE